MTRVGTAEVQQDQGPAPRTRMTRKALARIVPWRTAVRASRTWNGDAWTLRRRTSDAATEAASTWGVRRRHEARRRMTAAIRACGAARRLPRPRPHRWDRRS